jgi:glutamate-1-semialdehyde 2,1-aminomutase
MRYQDRERLARLWQDEVEIFSAARPASERLWREALVHLPDGVPMLWMAKWPGPWPVYVDSALGAHFWCVDGIEHLDLCLGDTGAMCGHAPAAAVQAISEQLERGATFMLPTADAAIAATLLAERFRVPSWQFTLTATDANRSLIRYARQVTGRHKIVVHDYCYHGSVDETFATLDESGAVVERRGTIGAPVAPAETTAVVPFNDVSALEAALDGGDIAAVLIEPALTNIGIVLPEPGYHEAMRALCTRYGALLIVDETHTFCAGPGGMTAALDLHPDAVVVGKSIGGGIPAAAFGMSADLADRARRSIELEDIDVGGVGGTLAGNAASLAGIRATLSEVFTDEAFATMIECASQWTAGVQAAIDEFGAPWQVTQLGARAEYSFRSSAPRDGAQAAEADDFELQQYLHLHALNRGILITPFHNMALMCPATTSTDVERHTVAFRQAVASLYGDRKERVSA